MKNLKNSNTEESISKNYNIIFKKKLYPGHSNNFL